MALKVFVSREDLISLGYCNSYSSAQTTYLKIIKLYASENENTNGRYLTFTEVGEALKVDPISILLGINAKSALGDVSVLIKRLKLDIDFIKKEKSLTLNKLS